MGACAFRTILLPVFARRPATATTIDMYYDEHDGYDYQNHLAGVQKNFQKQSATKKTDRPRAESG